MKKIIFLIFICFAFIPLFCETLAEPPLNFHEENAGSEENPFLISNLANLRWFSETPDVWGRHPETTNAYKYFFLQTSDIDASETQYWNNGEGFNPIGAAMWQQALSSARDFFGVYNGNGFSINNLHIFTPISHTIGFTRFAIFSAIDYAVLKNIRLVNIKIIPDIEKMDDKNSSVVAGLAGTVSNSTILNCSVSGQLFNEEYLDRKEYFYSSGLIYFALNSTIEECYSSVKIYGKTDYRTTVAGLVLHLHNSTLKNSYFNGSIITNQITNDIAGLVIRAATGNINNCYVTGGLGIIQAENFIRDILKYSTPDFNPSIVQNNFWNNETTDISKIVNITDEYDHIIENNLGLSTAEMKRVTIYEESGWDFETIWAINPNFNDGYPFLRSLHPEIEHVTEKDNVIKPLNQTWVYPNPVLGSEVNIKSTSRNNSLEVTIYNIRGQLINRSNEFFTKDGESVFVWNKRDLTNNEVTSGVYFYKIVDPNDKNSVHHGRFLILK